MQTLITGGILEQKACCEVDQPVRMSFFYPNFAVKAVQAFILAVPARILAVPARVLAVSARVLAVPVRVLAVPARVLAVPACILIVVIATGLAVDWATAAVQVQAGPDPTASTRSKKTIPIAEVLITGLQDARSVRATTQGNLFIVETGRHRILKTDPDGIRLDSVGRLGNGDYQLDEPAAIDPTNGLKIYVADRNNRRIQVFDGRLQYLSTIKLPHRSGQAARFTPSLIAVDPSGNIFFYDEEQQIVYRFDSSGRYDLDFGLHSEEERIDPVSMTVLDDVIWAVCRRGDLLHRFASHGAYLGFLYAPEHILEVRAIKGRLWLLGREHVMQVSAGGEVITAIPLPAAPQQKMQRRIGRRSSPPSIWRSFAVRDQTIYLLDGQTLVGIQVETDER